MTSDTELLSESEHEDLLHELRLACDNGDLQKISAFLALSAPALTADDLLDALCRSLDDLPVARCLLEHGADAKHVNYGMIKIGLEESKSLELLELLQEFGYDIKPDGHHFLAFVHKFSNWYSSANVLSRLFADSRTELDWLLDQGVDINGTRVPKNTQLGEWSIEILDQTAAAGDIELMKYLVSRGANPSQSLALHSATTCKDADKTRAMIACLITDHGMDIEADTEDLRDNFSYPEGSGTPLNAAIHQQNLAAVHELLKRGAKPVGIRDAVGQPPYSEPFISAIRPLLAAGASASEGLDTAVTLNNMEAARIFLECGADPSDDVLKERKVMEESSRGITDAYYETMTPEMQSLLKGWESLPEAKS